MCSSLLYQMYSIFPAIFGGYPVSCSFYSLIPLGYYFVAHRATFFRLPVPRWASSHDDTHGLVKNHAESVAYSKGAEPVDCCDLPSTFLDFEGFTPDGYSIRENGDPY